MRGYLPGVPDLVPNDQADHVPNPVALITRLPAILQEDEFLARWLSAFDDVIAPVYVTLDNLDAYVRPAYAPVDFLEWLAGWVDVAVDGAWTEQQRRSIVGGCASRCTDAPGPPAASATPCSSPPGPRRPSWSRSPAAPRGRSTPGADLPGSASAVVDITITVPKGDAAELVPRFERVAAAVVPAHLPTRVSVSVGGAS